MNLNARKTVVADNEKITATGYTLNYISLLAMEASEHYAEKGFDGMAKSAKEFGRDIHKFLADLGAYKEV